MRLEDLVHLASGPAKAVRHVRAVGDEPTRVRTGLVALSKSTQADCALTRKASRQPLGRALLALLIADYEAKHFPIADPDPIQCLETI